MSLSSRQIDITRYHNQAQIQDDQYKQLLEILQDNPIHGSLEMPATAGPAIADHQLVE